jgi:hypothetical protein
MTFTWGADPVNDAADWIRFELGETDSEDYFLEDEEIDAALALAEDDKQVAALSCIKLILRKLSKPNFRADWLQVDYEKARAEWRATLAEKTQEYGVSDGTGLSAGFTSVTRKD